jgi:hypothetical protein
VNKGAQPLEVLFHPLDAAITLHQYVALCVVQVHHDAQSALAMSSDGRLRNSLWNCANVNVAVVVSDSVNDVDGTFSFLPVIIHPGVVIALGGEVGHVSIAQDSYPYDIDFWGGFKGDLFGVNLVMNDF